MNKFGELIKSKREQMSLLQRHLASKIDIDVAMLSKIERGDKIAKKDTVVLFAEILNIDYNYLSTLWLADQIYLLVSEENNAVPALELVRVELNS